jgi:hypothetical protein
MTGPLRKIRSFAVQKSAGTPFRTRLGDIWRGWFVDAGFLVKDHLIR